MKVIMLESTNGVGMVGDVVNVKPGFARNYLLPKKKAVVADESNIKVFAHQKRIMEKRIAEAKKEAEGVRGNIHEQEITLVRKTAKANKLFGSVTSLDIQKAISEQLDVEVNRKGILLSEPIKKTGQYSVVIKLDGGVEATLAVVVEKDLVSSEPDEVVQAKEASEVQEEAPTEDKDQPEEEQQPKPQA